MKSIESPCTTRALADALKRVVSGNTTESTLDGTMNKDILKGVDNSKEMGNFIAALHRPQSIETGQPVENKNIKWTMNHIRNILKCN